MQNTLPGKILCVDYGRRHVGMAISDEGQRIAQQAKTRSVHSTAQSLKTVADFAREYDIKRIIVGIPLGLEAKPTQMSQEVMTFIAKLEELTALPVIAWNETGTSKFADINFRNSSKQKSHSEAARIMLQEYLDFQASGI